MTKRKKSYVHPEMQLVLYGEDDFVRTSMEVNWGKIWDIVPDNDFSDGFSEQ